MIDSELVPRGKGEKNSGKENEIEPETVYLQWLEVVIYYYNQVPIEEWSDELTVYSKVKIDRNLSR